jgi:hypothetical protein
MRLCFPFTARSLWHRGPVSQPGGALVRHPEFVDRLPSGKSTGALLIDN